jgi:tetratricopeptide (TPR) repeat protein
MSRPLSLSLSLAIVACLAGSCFAQSDRPLPEKPYPPGQIPPPELPPPADGGPNAYAYSTDEAILFFQGRVERAPRDYVSYRILGEFHEKKAEESGDLASYARAEAALRRSLEIAPKYDKAKASLAAVLCSRHQFAEGLALARSVIAKDPENIDALATLGDALLETGRYAEAEEAYNRLRKKGDAPPILARVASLQELKGDPDEALKLMAEADSKAFKASGAKGAAWFKARLGDIAFVAGRVDEAESFYQSVPPKTDPYHDATAALGRIRAGQGRIAEAIAFYEKAVAIGPDPHMLAALGDLYIKVGREAEAPAERMSTSGRSHSLIPITIATYPRPSNWPGSISSIARMSTVTTPWPGPCSRTTSPKKRPG